MPFEANSGLIRSGLLGPFVGLARDRQNVTTYSDLPRPPRMHRPAGGLLSAQELVSMFLAPCPPSPRSGIGMFRTLSDYDMN